MSSFNLKLPNISDFQFLNCLQRCQLTTVNPDTGEKEGDEPLETLRR